MANSAEIPPSIERLVDSVRDPNFYADDGNIVLSALDMGMCTIYFRLHRSLLVRHSPVFADMFTMPPPPLAETYDGIPLVQMSDDADALRTFIALLYDPQCVIYCIPAGDIANAAVQMHISHP